jgi:hypothetical protein
VTNATASYWRTALSQNSANSGFAFCAAWRSVRFRLDEKFTDMSKEFIIYSGPGILPVCFKTWADLPAIHGLQACATLNSQA